MNSYLIIRVKSFKPTVKAIKVTAIIATIALWCFLKNSIYFPLLSVIIVLYYKNFDLQNFKKSINIALWNL